MGQNTMVAMTDDERRFGRVPFTGTIRYQYANDLSGLATCRNLGHGGMCVRLGRYLRPGRLILLEVIDADDTVEPVEFKGRVVWCRPASSPCMFAAGVRVFHDDLDVARAIYAFMSQELVQSGAFEALPASRTVQEAAKECAARDRTVGPVVERTVAVRSRCCCH